VSKQYAVGGGAVLGQIYDINVEGSVWVLADGHKRALRGQKWLRGLGRPTEKWGAGKRLAKKGLWRGGAVEKVGQ